MDRQHRSRYVLAVYLIVMSLALSDRYTTATPSRHQATLA